MVDEKDVKQWCGEPLQGIPRTMVVVLGGRRPSHGAGINDIFSQLEMFAFNEPLPSG